MNPLDQRNCSNVGGARLLVREHLRELTVRTRVVVPCPQLELLFVFEGAHPYILWQEELGVYPV